MSSAAILVSSSQSLLTDRNSDGRKESHSLSQLVCLVSGGGEGGVEREGGWESDDMTEE